MAISFPKPGSPKWEDPNSDEYWQGRNDAETLKRAETIKADDSRSKRARYFLEKEEAERKAALESLG